MPSRLRAANIPQLLVVARKDSPLVIGRAENFTMLASDVPPLLSHTREVQYLEDLEVATLTQHEVHIYNLDGDEIEREIQTIDWDMEAAEKCGFEHFMLKEICEQPKALRDTLRARYKDGSLSFPVQIENLLENCKHLLITGCGTAYHAAMVASYVIEQVAGLPVEVLVASELRYRPHIRKEGEVCLLNQPERRNRRYHCISSFVEGAGYSDDRPDECSGLYAQQRSRLGPVYPSRSGNRCSLNKGLYNTALESLHHSFFDCQTGTILSFGGSRSTAWQDTVAHRQAGRYTAVCSQPVQQDKSILHGTAD